MRNHYVVVSLRWFEGIDYLTNFQLTKFAQVREKACFFWLLISSRVGRAVFEDDTTIFRPRRRSSCLRVAAGRQGESLHYNAKSNVCPTNAARQQTRHHLFRVVHGRSSCCIRAVDQSRQHGRRRGVNDTLQSVKTLLSLSRRIRAGIVSPQQRH